MQHTRRLLPDRQHAEQHVVYLGTAKRRASVGNPVAQWPLTMLHISAVVLAIQIAAWFVLAIMGSPYRLVVLASGAQAVVVWGIVMAWIIKELR